MRLTTVLVPLAILFLICPNSSEAEKQHVPRPPHPPYSLIRNTSSPSHKYAMAWGIKGRTVDWNLLENSTSDRSQSYLWSLIKDDKNLQNYIVDKKGKQVLGVVPHHHRSWKEDKFLSKYSAGGDYYAGAGYGCGHTDISTHWLQDESMAILFYDGKWWYEAIYVAEKVDGKFRIIEVGDAVESYLRRYLYRTKHQAYKAAHIADDRNPTIEAGNFRLTRNSLTVDVRAYIPKKWDDPKAFRYYGTMRLNLMHRKRGLTAQVASLRQRPRKPGED